MNYLIRFVQVHESFRQPEIEALAALNDIDLKWVFYSKDDEKSAKELIFRSISCKSIHEIWGHGNTYPSLYASTESLSRHLWPIYGQSSFRFRFDDYQGSRSWSSGREIIQTFSYLNLQGPVSMSSPEQTFTVFEQFEKDASEPNRLFIGRFVGGSSRTEILAKYTLKKREYINTTSMDSELAFLTANITCAAPDKLFYDPFVGTGSLPIACAHFGGLTLGSDIDGRMVRGTADKNIGTNFQQYALTGRWMGGIISDLTNTPLRTRARWLDGIVCDPPYGVREGLKVLGSKKEGKGREVQYINREAAHLQDDHIPPKRAYSLTAILDDILHFAALTLLDNGRISVWMPTSNDEQGNLDVPSHQALELVAECEQVFNKWSRKLLTYRRIPGLDAGENRQSVRKAAGGHANDLNVFRKRYFEGFKSVNEEAAQGREL
ncbi:uncharacterized protein KY384_002021 [Bacidia gigantensis]|uniref:uncharacterized protein n=1 Tax=Bacidia gigantensis TaxID=2732470 RepID=UPI001D05AAFF|nr:uncharacterized protein KY384_002021 [Bacidia gigantensis]KAG8533238.1 hypothetical protein KY384_002021 [Bacidia gigantensis]